MAYWIAADDENVEKNFEWAGGSFLGTFDALVAAYPQYFFFEYENDEQWLRNLVSSVEFTAEMVTADLIGGVHSPQRPK